MNHFPLQTCNENGQLDNMLPCRSRFSKRWFSFWPLGTRSLCSQYQIRPPRWHAMHFLLAPSRHCSANGRIP